MGKFIMRITLENNGKTFAFWKYKESCWLRRYRRCGICQGIRIYKLCLKSSSKTRSEADSAKRKVYYYCGYLYRRGNLTSLGKCLVWPNEQALSFRFFSWCCETTCTPCRTFKAKRISNEDLWWLFRRGIYSPIKTCCNTCRPGMARQAFPCLYQRSLVRF